MCLYSQDNIQTLATHSPTFVWEGGGRKGIRGSRFERQDIFGNGNRHKAVENLQYFQKEQTLSERFSQFWVFCKKMTELSFPPPSSHSTHESVILSKGKNESQIDSYKPEIYTFYTFQKCKEM